MVLHTFSSLNFMAQAKRLAVRSNSCYIASFTLRPFQRIDCKKTARFATLIFPVKCSICETLSQHSLQSIAISCKFCDELNIFYYSLTKFALFKLKNSTLLTAKFCKLAQPNLSSAKRPPAGHSRHQPSFLQIMMMLLCCCCCCCSIPKALNKQSL